LQEALDQETIRAQQQAMDAPERVRTAGAVDSQIRVPQTAVTSQADYDAFLQSLRTDVVPEWHWEVDSEVRLGDAPTECVVLVEFVSASPMPQKSPNTEAFLFDAGATFAYMGGEVRPFELELAPRGFRYDRDLWGRGFNCAVERTDAQPPMFITTHTPIYRQRRYATRTAPPARFSALAQRPIPTLEVILDAMSAYRQAWDAARQQYLAADPNWEMQFAVEFDADRQRFEEEIDRFRRGCQLIREDADVRFAFQLTNETFRRGSKSEWRLFQIVFTEIEVHRAGRTFYAHTAVLLNIPHRQFDAFFNLPQWQAIAAARFFGLPEVANRLLSDFAPTVSAGQTAADSGLSAADLDDLFRRRASGELTAEQIRGDASTASAAAARAAGEFAGWYRPSPDATDGRALANVGAGRAGDAGGRHAAGKRPA